MGWQIFWLIFTLAVSYLTRPKPVRPKPAAFEDIPIPQSAEGTEQQWIFGTCWVPDWMVLGAGNWRSQAIKKKGKKK